MKLFTRYFRINLLATLVIFLLASIAFYFLLWWVMINQVDEDLKIEQREIETYVSKYHRPPEPITVKDQRISYEVTGLHEFSRHFSTIKSPYRHDREDFRQISFTLPVGDQWLLFKVSKSLEGTQDMNRSIIIISLLTVILILVVSLLINRWLLRRLWQPFYSTLSGVKKFRLGEKKTPSFAPSSIDEFNLLNKTLDQFIQGAEKEYTLLKEFTENASHELQTPLAIVQSKLDTLIQDEHLSEAQSNAAQTAFEAIRKMAKLNQSLLLLSKIENRQFSETSSFDFKSITEEKMAAWQELWQGKNLKITSSLESTFITMNTQLADILLNNLFSNAARHTVEGGSVHMKLHQNEFTISNDASGGALDATKLFLRFSKGGQSTDQYGLGLSIVQQIVEVSGKRISYHFEKGQHFFTISF
ncbi:MAG TPA: HAMP domain-containing sensor histidine kinase [Puia sp.]|jgi:signal transduction histidine kinase|nr:HAMP domain-containing sensor histidine kinase [Puia sp.]